MQTPIDLFVLTRTHFLIFLSVVLAFAFILQLLYRSKRIKSVKIFKYLFWGAATFPFLYYLYLTYAQYLEWKGENGPAKFLVPPYTGAGYVIKYHFIGFYIYYLVSLIVAVLFLILTIWLNNKYKKRFFEDEEPYIGGMAISLTGYPGFVIYLVIILTSQLILTFGRIVLFRKSERVPFYYLWLPAGLFAILLMYKYHLFYFA